MIKPWQVLVPLLAAALGAAGQPAALAGKPVIEVAGRIGKVGIAYGQGTPSLELKTADGKLWKVWLGSMRYLVEQNFNPKAGQQASARGFETAEGELVAISVTLTEGKQTIRLRDEQGRPLWRGRYRGGRSEPA